MSHRSHFTLFLVILICAAVSLLSASVSAGTHPLTAAAEGMSIGGSDCSDLMDGLAVGMGIGMLFGCVWCGAGAIAAKAIGLFC